MNVCVSSYSFNRLMQRGEMTQLSTIKAAKELGFDGIEFADIRPHDGSTPEDYARALRAEADKYELPIISFVFGADLINGRDGRTVEEEIANVKRMIDIGEILGVKLIRHDVLYSLGAYKSFDALLPTLAARVSEISEYAKTKGIRTSVENHGYICQDPDRCEKLYNAVTSDNFGWLCDMGNFLCADADPVLAVSRMAPYVIFAHAKDFYVKSGDTDNPGTGFFKSRGGNYLKGTIVGHGNVPVKQCLGILKRAGYDGYLSLEFEGMEEVMTALEIGLANLRRFISEI